MNEKEVEIKITPEIDLTTYQNQIKQMEKELSNLDKRIAGYYKKQRKRTRNFLAGRSLCTAYRSFV